MSPETKKLLKGYLDLSGGQQDEFDRALADYASEMRRICTLPKHHPQAARCVQVARKCFRNLHDLW